MRLNKLYTRAKIIKDINFSGGLNVVTGESLHKALFVELLKFILLKVKSNAELKKIIGRCSGICVYLDFEVDGVSHTVAREVLKQDIVVIDGQAFSFIEAEKFLTNLLGLNEIGYRSIVSALFKDKPTNFSAKKTSLLFPYLYLLGIDLKICRSIQDNIDKTILAKKQLKDIDKEIGEVFYCRDMGDVRAKINGINGEIEKLNKKGLSVPHNLEASLNRLKYLFARGEELENIISRARLNKLKAGLPLVSDVHGLDLLSINNVLKEIHRKIFDCGVGGILHLSYNDTNSFININLWTGESSRYQYIYNDQSKSFILDVALLLASEVREKHLGFLISNYSLSKSPNILLRALEQLILKLDKSVQYILPLDIALVTEELQEKTASYITNIESCEQDVIENIVQESRSKNCQARNYLNKSWVDSSAILGVGVS